jgi:O-antigen/teichoic acid export membrane protein
MKYILHSYRNLNMRRHFYGSFALFVPTIAVQVYTVVNKNMIGTRFYFGSLGVFNQSNIIIQTALAVVSTLNVVMLPITFIFKGDVRLRCIEILSRHLI